MKLKLAPALILFASLIGAPPSFAVTDCLYKVQKVYVSLDPSGMVYVHLMDAQGNHKGSIFKNNVMVSEVILSRFHAQILSAKVSDRTIIVRFPETGADCSAIVTPARSDIVGVWVQDP
ncbi:MAG: hypothetical protein AAF642_01385 [Pseudomonadota bacterium]